MDSGLHRARNDPRERSCESLHGRQFLQSHVPVPAKTNHNHQYSRFQRRLALDVAHPAPGRPPQCRHRAFLPLCTLAASATQVSACCPEDPVPRPIRRQTKLSNESLRDRSRQVCSANARIPCLPLFPKRRHPPRGRPISDPCRQRAWSPCARTPQIPSSQISGPSREEWHIHFPLARDFPRCAWTMLRTCPPPPAAARRNPLQVESAVQSLYRSRSRGRALDPCTMSSRGPFRKPPVGESAPA